MSERIACLLTHSCSDGFCHAKARCMNGSPCRSCRIARAFRRHAITLLVDRFRPGDVVRLRMETFRFDAVLYLISGASLQSTPCAIELAAAETHECPIFCIHCSGVVPEKFRQRLYLRESELDSPEGFDRLATAIRVHVAIQRHLRAVVDPAPTVSRKAACDLYWDDPSVLAEYLGTLEKAYLSIEDEYTRCWVAYAIQNTQAPESSLVLQRLSVHETRPYPREGLNPSMLNPLRRDK